MQSLTKYPEGNCKHKISVSTESADEVTDKLNHTTYTEYNHPPVVWLANDSDLYYGEVFTSRKDLTAFIQKLIDARAEAWPLGVYEQETIQ